MIRHAVLVILWVTSLAVTSALARQAATPTPAPQGPNPLSMTIGGDDIAFRVTSVQSRGMIGGSNVVVGTLMIRVNGIWREAAINPMTGLVPAN